MDRCEAELPAKNERMMCTPVMGAFPADPPETTDDNQWGLYIISNDMPPQTQGKYFATQEECERAGEALHDTSYRCIQDPCSGMVCGQ